MVCSTKFREKTEQVGRWNIYETRYFRGQSKNKKWGKTARVEPSVKEQAEEIMEMLGIPVSVVINTLYKQIIMTRSIPFSLSVPAVPVARDEMDEAAFHAMMERGLNEAKADKSRAASDVFADLKREMQ